MRLRERMTHRAAFLAGALVVSACAGAPVRTSEQVQAEVYARGR